MEVGFPIFFGVVTTMVVVPNLLINCIPAADTPLTNNSLPSHCSPLKIYLPSSALDAGSTITRYEHLESVLISNVSGADGTRRECQFVCLYGQWQGPLCRRMDMLQHKSSQNYQPVWQSCYFEPSQYENVSIFYNGLNISEPTGDEGNDGWPSRMTVFPHGGRLMLRCKDVGEFIFHGPPVLQCQNGQWEPVTLRAGSAYERAPFARPTCERIPELDSIVEEKILYPPIITAVTYSHLGTVAPFYDGRLFVYPGSDLNLGCIYEPRRLGPPKWTWSKSASPDVQMQWTRNLWRNKMEWRLTIRNIKSDDSGKYTCTTPFGTSHSYVVEVAAIDCPRPFHDEQLITSGSFRFNGTVTFSCQPGYRLIGPESVYCKLNGEWMRELPSCQPINCPPLYTNDSLLMIESNGTAYEDVALFSCVTGYRVSHNTSSTHCTAHGNWSHSIPVCESVFCPSIRAPISGHATEPLEERYLVGRTVGFACEKGFLVNGPTNSTCTEEGRWSNPPPRCEQACDAPKAPRHGRVVPGKLFYRIKSHVVYECHSGYRLVGARISYCNPDGKWSFPVPDCMVDVNAKPRY